MSDSYRDSTPPSPGGHGGGSSTVASSVFLEQGAATRPRSKRALRQFSTLCAVVDDPDAAHHDQHGSSSVPIYQTATFKGECKRRS